MPDNKEKIGGQDRTRVADNEDYEIQYMVEKTGASREEVKKAIEKVGNNREKVIEFLKRK
jgi:translation elongation factor EF-Ts